MAHALVMALAATQGSEMQALRLSTAIFQVRR